MDHRRQKSTGPATKGHTAIGSEKKTAARLIEHLEALWEQTRPAFGQERTWQRARALGLSSLVCLGRRTITGIVMAGGGQFEDWTANYRLFCRERFDADRLFDPVRRGVLAQLPANAPFVTAMDDSIFRKTGKKTHGVAYRRDPLGPAFHTNFVRAQRFLQISAALPAGQGASPARMIPIDFRHCPTPKKPRKNALEKDWAEYRLAQKETKISRRGAERLHALRHALDSEPDGKQRPLVNSVDGGYTNATVLKNLPERTFLIGRIRKDAKLYYPPRPETSARRGRKRSYGQRAPTPQELRQDSTAPWQTLTAWAAGKRHTFKVKTIAPLKWRAAGQKQELRLVVIAPLGYRLSKKSPILYRKPAYLISTNPDMALEEILQYYLWRWDIEVNLREEKTLIGAGQAQVRHPESVEKVPALLIASYAMLLLAARETFGKGERIPDALPKPKWRQNEKRQRLTTGQLLNHLRAELWGKAMGLENFSGFVKQTRPHTKPQKFTPHLASAVCYAYG